MTQRWAPQTRYALWRNTSEYNERFDLIIKKETKNNQKIARLQRLLSLKIKQNYLSQKLHDNVIITMITRL